MQYLVGVLCKLLSSSLEAVAYAIWRRRHMPGCEWSQWEWFKGFLIFLVGNSLDFAALGFIKPSVVIMVGSWSIPFSLLISSEMCNEAVNMEQIKACACIVLGIVMSVAGAATMGTAWDLNSLLSQYTKPKSIVLMSLLALSVILIGYTIERRDDERSKRLYCIMAAVAGVITILLSKTASMTLQYLLRDVYINPFSLIVCLFFAMSLALQLVLIDKSLTVNESGQSMKL